VAEASEAAFAEFDTPIGACAIVWRSDRIVGTFLPAATPGAMASHVRRKFGEIATADPPAHIAELIALIRRLLRGDRVTFDGLGLDMSGVSPFDRRVYAATAAIPPRETRTYGEVASKLGNAGAAQAVGRALGSNPFPILIPCHRVLASGGRSGGFTAPGGLATKFRILELEGAGSSDALLFGSLPLKIRQRD
jgi:methylated-DNA-[protein]-cysteine S-methyltransferase